MVRPHNERPRSSKGTFRPRGFTLIELLVVIAIIGVLVALLMPAVQAARETARRLQCQNNLKQIGLGMHNYHGSQGCFPMSTTAAVSYGSECGNGFYSWLTGILPFVEQTTLYNSINFNVAMVDACDQTSSSDYVDLTISADHPNAGAAATVVSGFLCPSDSYLLNDVLGSSQPAPGSYAGNFGWPMAVTGFDGENPPLNRHNGFFGVINPNQPKDWQVARVREADFADGLSNTAAVAERLITGVQDYDDLFGAPISLKSFCGGGGARRSLKRWLTYCGGVSAADPLYSKPHGRAWISGWTLAANSYMHVMPINDRNCHIYGGEEDGVNIVTPSSQHPGGVNVLMGDGRVVFVNEAINMQVWWSIGSRDGGEPHSLTEP